MTSEGNNFEEGQVDESEYPTLCEAVNMSRGIRTTTKRVTSSQKQQQKHDGVAETGSQDDVTDEAVVPEEEEEEPEIVRSAFENLPPPPPVEPLFEANEDGSLPGKKSNFLIILINLCFLFFF